MRLRKKPWIERAIGEYYDSGEIITDPTPFKGHWRELLGREEIALEIGCGKGDFVTGMAELYPDRGFVAIEYEKEVAFYPAAKAREKELQNVRVISGDAANLTDWFASGEISVIYLNFSDPWPKARHAKRRLTFRTFLARYKEILMPGGHLRFKTDNDGLFEFSLEEFREFGLQIIAETRDLHSSTYENEVQTEYEKKFSARGKNINFCEVVF